MKRTDQRYQSFLVRCWRVDVEQSSQQDGWRFSIESADGQGKRQGFSDPSKLLDYLKEQVEYKTDEQITSKK